MNWQQRYVHRFYESRPGWVCGTTEFHELCRELTPTGATLLEIGAGPSNATSRYLATIGAVYGIDIDSEVLRNDALREAHVFDGTTLPFADESIDVCVSNWVVEHLTNPEAHLVEVRRVLKPGGIYAFRTSNCWHYIGGIAHLTPHWFHVLVANRLRNLPVGTRDPYPTMYRMNSRRKVLQLAHRCGLAVERLRMVEKEPSYGMGSRLLFLAFLAYERLVNSTDLLAPFRATIHCAMRKPSTAGTGSPV